MCNGDNKWKLKHLSNNTAVQTLFTERVAPLACKKAATLDPWSNLNINKVQVILQGWQSSIGSKVLETVKKLLIDKNKPEMEKMICKHHEENPNSELTLKDLIMDQIEAHLQKKPLQPGSELYTYAY